MVTLGKSFTRGVAYFTEEVLGTHLLPEVTKLKPWVSMATPVLWTCSSMYQLMKEDLPAEWFPGRRHMMVIDNIKK
jgi:hypothetical protein